MPGTAVLFPGQGSQTEDMRETVERLRPDLIDQAAQVVGDDPFERVADGTRYAQPAIYCASIAGWSLLGDLRPGAIAGHSLGEIAALVAAGALDERAGLELVALRGRLMEEAATAGEAGGMIAVGAPIDRVAPLAESLGLSLANDNSPEQVVLSGSSEAVDEMRAQAKAHGLKALRLRVSGAFHSPAMEPAIPEFEAALARAEFAEPRTTVLSCVTAAPVDDPRRLLAAGLTSAVRWRETLLALRDMGIDRYVETGPGKVLTGLVRRTLPGAEAHVATEATHV